MDKKSKVKKQFQRGKRHGRLSVYNPGVMGNKARLAYIKGYQAGRTIRFVTT